MPKNILTFCFEFCPATVWFGQSENLVIFGAWGSTGRRVKGSLGRLTLHNIKFTYHKSQSSSVGRAMWSEHWEWIWNTNRDKKSTLLLFPIKTHACAPLYRKYVGLSQLEPVVLMWVPFPIRKQSSWQAIVKIHSFMFIHSFIIHNHPHNHSALVQSLSSVIYVYLAHGLFCMFVNQCTFLSGKYRNCPKYQEMGLWEK